jgi:carbamoyltransferase
MKIVGLWSGHDCSFSILEDGNPVIHAEYERYIREKEPKGDSISFFLETMKNPNLEDFSHYVSVFPEKTLLSHNSINKLNVPVTFYGHHTAHAAHAFYSSKFDNALVITVDGGGVESDMGFETATTFWQGSGKKLNFALAIPSHQCNIGGLWTRATRSVFRMQNGWPRGHQAGTIMAMAALGDPNKYKNDFMKMLTSDIIPASAKDPDQPVGAYVGTDPRHRYLGKWMDIADRSEKDTFDLAAGFQEATEEFFREKILRPVIGDSKNLCFAGGVALNSVLVGKIKTWFPQLDNVFVPPVPYDGGLCIGASQYHYHHVLSYPRVKWEDNFSPYLGEIYSEEAVMAAISENFDNITSQYKEDDVVIEALLKGKIVSVFNAGSESGRRALGNRSILADPRVNDMKEKINLKVKHRQWFRPFAPSILRNHVTAWFAEDVSSPYMTHVLKFREDAKRKVPAVVHFDDSARLQTVTENDNPWYFSLLTKWYNKTGIPILLNTSFNDSTPIVETPKDAIKCFLSTDIDYLYFVDAKQLVERKK